MMRKRFPLRDTAAAWFLLFLPMMTGTLKAMIRYQATNITIFVAAGRLATRRLFQPILFASLALMCFEMFLFSRGHAHY